MTSKSEVLLSSIVILVCLRVFLAEVVTIEDGKVEGKIVKTRSDESFYSFLKIPFAEPPIDELRFAAPVPKRPWGDILPCISYGPVCMQPNTWGFQSVSEDCLHLNLFTKNLPTDSTVELKPVIVYMHGGGFETGSAMEHGPEYLMERDIVLVTMNYRLGAFGFLAVETPEIPGNAGLKDQSLALQWVQKNIVHFGGDPEKVTIAGLSAGAFSVTGHMMSRMSQGLFHNVIAMSGALAWQKKLQTNNFDAAKTMADRINCTTRTVEETIKCLKEKPAEEISENMIIPYLSCPVMTWLPVVEPDFGQERFLVDDPNHLLREGNFSKVNLMIGITADEFISPAAAMLENSHYASLLNQKFDDIAPACFFFEGRESRSAEEIARILRKSYLHFDVIDNRSFQGLNNLFADGLIGYGVHRFVRYVREHVDVYFYKFSFVGRFSLFKYPNNKPYGVHHADDIQYVFNASYVGPSISKLDPEAITVERMTRIWEQFASTGNPNSATDEYLAEMNWPKHDAASELYLDIGTYFIEKHSLFIERYKVWDSLEASSASLIKVEFLIFSIFLLTLIHL